MKPYAFNSAQEDWVCDLETTDAPQGTGALYQKSGSKKGYCRLGRACVSLGIEMDEYSPFNCTFLGHCCDLPDRAVKALKLRTMNGAFLVPHENGARSLVSLNDDHIWSFKQIAAYIRTNPRNVFIDEEELAHAG
jgi:hypothetical protein